MLSRMDLTPTINRLRPVLITVAVPAVHHMATERAGPGVMEIAHCDFLPGPTFMEEQAIYTFSRLVKFDRILRINFFLKFLTRGDGSPLGKPALDTPLF